MYNFPPTIILRHRKENLKKCSLRGMESRSDFRFYTYPNSLLPNLSSYIILSMNAPFLTSRDSQHGLFVLDGTWRYAQKMTNNLKPIPNLIHRTIPSNYQTAYPRKQNDCPSPEYGLASIEAIFIAYWIMHRPLQGILDNYYWKEKFLMINQFLIK